jgi:hypothetical protein
MTLDLNLESTACGRAQAAIGGDHRRALSRPPTGTRLPGDLCYAWKRMSRRTPVIRRPTGKSSGGGRGKPSGRGVTYVPYDPSSETPDGGGTTGRLTGIQSVSESIPVAYS